MAIEADLHYSDPRSSSSKVYHPPTELPFTSKGSFGMDKEEYQRIRFDLHGQYCKAIRKSPIGSFKSENAKEEMKKIGKLDKYFGINDILTEAITDPAAHVRRSRDLDIAGKFF